MTAISPDPLRRPLSVPPRADSTPPAGAPPQPPKPTDCFESIESARAKAVGIRGDPGLTSLSRAEVSRLAEQLGRRPTVGLLAELYPNATVDGRGEPLARLAQRELHAAAGPVPLALVPVDKNGDLDVSQFLRAELAKQNPNLVVRKDDEVPMPLAFTLAHGALVVRDARQKELLARGGFSADSEGALRINLQDPSAVRRALSTLGFNPDDALMRERELAQQGVHVPLQLDDQLRRVLIGRLDSAENEVDIDDGVVSHPAANNASVRPTVYASAKINPGRLDEVVLAYKRFNNQSFASQGNWVTHLLGKDKHPQHEFDNEAMFVKLDAASGERKAVLTARHYYGRHYDPNQLRTNQVLAERGDLTTSVSALAHGAALAEQEPKKEWAGMGEDGVSRFNPLDRVFSDDFPGLSETKPGGRAVFIPKEQIDLVVETDDQQTLNLKTQFGATKKGLWGTKILDTFNDGQPVDRFGGTDWYYAQEAMQAGK